MGRVRRKLSTGAIAKYQPHFHVFYIFHGKNTIYTIKLVVYHLTSMYSCIFVVLYFYISIVYFYVRFHFK